MEYVFPVFGLLILAAFVLVPIVRRLRGRRRVDVPPSGRWHSAGPGASTLNNNYPSGDYSSGGSGGESGGGGG